VYCVLIGVRFRSATSASASLELARCGVRLGRLEAWRLKAGHVHEGLGDVSSGHVSRRRLGKGTASSRPAPGFSRFLRLHPPCSLYLLFFSRSPYASPISLSSPVLTYFPPTFFSLPQLVSWAPASLTRLNLDHDTLRPPRISARIPLARARIDLRRCAGQGGAVAGGSYWYLQGKDSEGGGSERDLTWMDKSV